MFYNFFCLILWLLYILKLAYGSPLNDRSAHGEDNASLSSSQPVAHHISILSTSIFFNSNF